MRQRAQPDTVGMASVPRRVFGEWLFLIFGDASFLDRSFIFFLSLFGHTFLESVDATAGVEDFLFAGVERMAVGADFHLNFRQSRAGVPSMSTSAFDLGIAIVFGMNIRLHMVAMLAPLMRMVNFGILPKLSHFNKDSLFYG